MAFIYQKVTKPLLLKLANELTFHQKIVFIKKRSDCGHILESISDYAVLTGTKIS